MMCTSLLMGFLILNGCASAFQPPTTTSLAPSLLNLCHHQKGKTHHMHNNIVLFSQDDDSNEDPQLPFFTRALQKLRQKKDEKAGGDISEVIAKTDDTIETNNNIDSEAATLRALAAKTRLDAEKMDMSLTLAKIEKLEGKIISEKDDKLRASLMKETQMLLNKLNGVVPTPIKEKESNKSSSSSESESLSISDDMNEQNVVQDILDGNKPLLSEDKQDDAIKGFDQLPVQLKDMMARSVGMKDGSNSTAVIEKLMKEKKLYQPENDEENFSFLANATEIEDLDVFVDTDFAELNRFVESLLPEVTRKTPVKEEFIDTLYTDNILGKDTFNPRDKPQAIPGGYLIRGESRVKSVEGKDDGDVLIEALDEKISKSSVAGKIQVNYILDPTPPSPQDILQEVDETPVLYVTNCLSPDTQPLAKLVVTLLGLSSILIFAVGSFALNTDIVDRISATANTMDIGSLDWLYNLSLPLALAMLATQLFHELGHLIVAVKEDINIGLPTLIPGVQFGLTGAVTPIKSSPKNFKSLFDFAIAGPLLGLSASIVLLYVGLEMTVFMDSSALEQLPSVPLVLLRSSALGGGIIDYLMGDGVLNSPDPSLMIKLHPLALAGFGGLVINALSLLPIGNTDGGRISIAFFGRSFSRAVQGTTLLGLVIAGLFGADQVDILLTYAVYCQIWQKETEIPCRNEVDELDTVRGFIAIGASLIVFLTLTPLPY